MSNRVLRKENPGDMTAGAKKNPGQISRRQAAEVQLDYGTEQANAIW